MRFEWDAAKNGSNLQKHGVDFVFATRAFADQNAVTVQLVRGGETRSATLAAIEGRVFVIVWTIRSGFVRIISARKANARETKRYYGPR